MAAVGRPWLASAMPLDARGHRDKNHFLCHSLVTYECWRRLPSNLACVMVSVTMCGAACFWPNTLLREVYRIHKRYRLSWKRCISRSLPLHVHPTAAAHTSFITSQAHGRQKGWGQHAHSSVYRSMRRSGRPWALSHPCLVKDNLITVVASKRRPRGRSRIQNPQDAQASQAGVALTQNPKCTGATMEHGGDGERGTCVCGKGQMPCLGTPSFSGWAGPPK
jgi:hypothetical protein